LSSSSKVTIPFAISRKKKAFSQPIILKLKTLPDGVEKGQVGGKKYYKKGYKNKCPKKWECAPKYGL